MWWAPPKGTHFCWKKITSLRAKKHKGQCVNDDPMIPSSFLSSTGNTYTYTNPRSVNRNIWPMSTLKSCSLFDRSTCHSLRGWTSGTAIRGNLEWMMLCRTTKVPRLDTFGSLKPKKIHRNVLFWKSLFCYLSTTSSFSLCEMFVPIELAKNQQNPVFIVPLHIPPPKVFVGLCKMNPFLEPYFLMKKVPSIATSWTVTHPNFEPKFTHKQLKAMGHQRRPLANRNEGVFSPEIKKQTNTKIDVF